MDERTKEDRDLDVFIARRILKTPKRLRKETSFNMKTYLREEIIDKNKPMLKKSKSIFAVLFQTIESEENVEIIMKGFLVHEFNVFFSYFERLRMNGVECLKTMKELMELFCDFVEFVEFDGNKCVELVYYVKGMLILKKKEYVGCLKKKKEISDMEKIIDGLEMKYSVFLDVNAFTDSKTFERVCFIGDTKLSLLFLGCGMSKLRSEINLAKKEIQRLLREFEKRKKERILRIPQLTKLKETTHNEEDLLKSIFNFDDRYIKLDERWMKRRGADFIIKNLKYPEICTRKHKKTFYCGNFYCGKFYIRDWYNELRKLLMKNGFKDWIEKECKLVWWFFAEVYFSELENGVCKNENRKHECRKFGCDKFHLIGSYYKTRRMEFWSKSYSLLGDNEKKFISESRYFSMNIITYRSVLYSVKKNSKGEYDVYLLLGLSRETRNGLTDKKERVFHFGHFGGKIRILPPANAFPNASCFDLDGFDTALRELEEEVVSIGWGINSSRSGNCLNRKFSIRNKIISFSDLRLVDAVYFHVFLLPIEYFNIEEILKPKMKMMEERGEWLDNANYKFVKVRNNCFFR